MENKDWYKSTILLISSIVTLVNVLFALDAEVVKAINTAMLALFNAACAVYVLYARLFRKNPPLKR